MKILCLASFVVAVSLSLSVSTVAHAEAPHRTAFALIVTNNRGSGIDRPNLQYADDDGVHYYELFQTLAPVSNIHLLTELDRDTTRLFPALHPSAPSRANVARAVASIAKDVVAATRAGDDVDFYFVYAGHGDVDHGRGFIELSDGPFDGGDLEKLLAAIPATQAHVILDSCNSFFMITPRKPGGRRITTPRDATAGLVQRLSNVGVFVSTSAEAEVFEWSELQSGVFSHAVRSGLAGAADANGDGVVSYDELRAFVDTATADVPNAAFRPKVFARGPGGNDRTAMFAATTGTRLTIPAASAPRFTIRDRDELPWIDAYKEDGASLVLHLPADLAAGTIDQPREGHRLQLPAPLPPVLVTSELEPRSFQLSARGPDDVFRRMFSRPFGPLALARYDADRANAPPEIFGISHDDVERMKLLLAQVDDEQREVREIQAASQVGIGLFMGGLAIYEREPVGMVAGGAVVAYGAYRFLSSSSAENLRVDFQTQLAGHQDPALAVAKIDARLHTLAGQARHQRHVAIVLSLIDMALTGTMFAIDRADHRVFSRDNGAFDSLTAVCGAIGAVTLLSSVSETPVERTARSWDDNLSLGSVPVRSVGLGGTF